jgi:hypothetical protein
LAISLMVFCASKSSNLSSICAQTTSLPSSSEKGGQNGNVGKYDYFMEEVEPGKKLKYRRVRCLLCGDGTIISFGNFGNHVKALHEPPVVCEICQKEFNAMTIVTHKRKWHNEIKGNNNVDRNDDTEDLSPSVKYTTSQPDQSEPDLSNTIPSVSAKSANMPILPPTLFLPNNLRKN